MDLVTFSSVGTWGVSFVISDHSTSSSLLTAAMTARAVPEVRRFFLSSYVGEKRGMVKKPQILPFSDLRLHMNIIFHVASPAKFSQNQIVQNQLQNKEVSASILQNEF